VVERAIYLGSSRKLELRLPDGEPRWSVSWPDGSRTYGPEIRSPRLAVADSVLLPDDPMWRLLSREPAHPHFDGARRRAAHRQLRQR